MHTHTHTLMHTRINGPTYSTYIPTNIHTHELLANVRAVTNARHPHPHTWTHSLKDTHTHIHIHTHSQIDTEMQPRCHFRFRCTRARRCVERACVCEWGSPVDNPAVNCSQLYGKLYKSQLTVWNMIKQSVCLWVHLLKRSKRIILKQKYLKLTL